ncbi:hypothetical protein [Marimonas arenosa]|uniref:Uncharacterized protein n=1 Tax=Marimonas arenosa TaxID=1795305 RepID=A0AAE4B5C3_9RHOB|nr:hypothetical protein [Marimonas arenosa]MDQ2089106.1 hypothetical protein [Marimonas arenosa]
MKGDALDPKALIREAYHMDIGPAECRTIFLDWALSLPEGTDTLAALEALLRRYGADTGHPMTTVLRQGLEKASRTGRRGGRRGRLQG